MDAPDPRPGRPDAGPRTLGPRLVVAGTHSGVGKTTVATGLMAALAARGLVVAAAKVGPDFIDPGYHSLATGRPSRNLDPWICGEAAVAPLAARAGAGADVLVVEGVMGLFDGAADDGATASTAHVARLLSAPVVLVVDVGAMSGSVAAVVHGFTTFDPSVQVAGVILNNVAGHGHEAMVRRALGDTGVAILGAVRRDPALRWRERHLGLVPVVERPEQVRRSVELVADAIGAGCDLEAVIGLARLAPPIAAPPPPEARPSGRAVVAVAGGPAFSFAYPDNLEALEQAGAVLAPFDPVRDPSLPDGATGLVAGGGFPEVFAEALAANRPLLADVRRRVAAGLVVWAECGGLLWLSRSLDGHAMCGALPAEGRLTDRLTLGYRRALATTSGPLAPSGAPLRGHEFHYSVLEPPGEALELDGRSGPTRAGFVSPSVMASYLHLHLGGDPGPAERFVATAAAAARPS
ncbi:MAG TPA: cobyrinate a,c-diamide synthase [Acidimicrobiales bacterium]|nr:cobyrinate a,c-diamide synthase [Acidimicrobiales bacterium]